MKNYKLDYSREKIGVSDIACLIFVGMDKSDEHWSIKCEVIEFAGDGDYFAYIVDEECAIPEHYNKEAEFDSWLRIYDDDICTRNFHAKKINVYRAAGYGCIIQLIKE